MDNLINEIVTKIYTPENIKIVLYTIATLVTISLILLFIQIIIWQIKDIIQVFVKN